MGTTGIVACTAAVLADKACGAEDKKKLNGALAATSLINAGFFAFVILTQVPPIARMSGANWSELKAKTLKYVTQRDFRTFPNFNFGKMASTRRGATATPSS